MKRLLAILLSVSTALGQVNVQKASGTNEISGSLVVGSGKTLTATGTGTIVATGGTASTVPWSGVTGTPTTLAGYGITSPLLPTVGGTGQSTWTLGDFLYANGTNTLAKLPGSTSATLAVLTQTGNGTVSAAPVWTSTTGTGNVVRATSPTLVTPTIDTITAPTTTPLTLTGGSTGASMVLGQSATGGATLTVGSATTPALTISGAASPLVRTSSTGGARQGFEAYTASGLRAEWTVNAGTGEVRMGGVSTGGYFPTFYSNNAEAGRFSTTGNLLIGTTTDAASLAGGLVVNGSGAGAAASSTTTGALRVTGGVGVSGAGYFGGSLFLSGRTQTSLSSDAGNSIAITDTTGAQPTLKLFDGATQTARLETASGDLYISTAQAAKSVIIRTGNAATAATFSAAGGLNIVGTTSASSSIAGALTIGNGTAATNVAIGGGQVAIGGGNLSANGQSALTVAPTITPITGNIYGLKMDLSTLSGASAGNVNPVSVASTNTGTTNVADQTVFQSTVNQSATSGTLTNVINYRATNALLNAGNISNIYGFRFVDTFASSTGVVASQYAFYADAMTRGTVNNYAFYSAGSTPSYFGGNVQVGGTSFQVLSTNNAKVAVDTSGSSGALSLVSNAQGNYRTLKFGYGVSATNLWQIGYQGGTTDTNLNFEPASPGYEAVFLGTGASTTTTSGALQTRGGLGVAGAAWVGGAVNSAGINVTTGSNIVGTLKSSSAAGPYLYLSSTNVAGTTATIAGSDFVNTIALSAGNVTTSSNFGVGGQVSISTGASDAFLNFITSGTTAAQTIQFQDSGGGSGAISYSHTTNALSFKTNGTTWASLNNAGAMQIGSVAAPTYGTAGKLYVYGGPARININGASSTWNKVLTFTPALDDFRHVHQYAWSNTANTVALKWVKEINGTETDMMSITDGNLTVSGTGTSTFAGNVTSSGSIFSTNVSLYNTDATISNYSAANGVYINGNAGGWLRMSGSGGGAAQIQLNGGATGAIYMNTATANALVLNGTTGAVSFASTGTASNTTSGALVLGSNVGLSGNAGGASYFGGDITLTNAASTPTLTVKSSALGATSKLVLGDGVNNDTNTLSSFGGTATISRNASALLTLSSTTATFAGDVALSTAGKTISVKSGTNAAAGTVTLSSGNGTITSTAIDVNTVIVMSIKTKTGSFDHAPSVVVAAGSATIDGHNSDDSTYNWIALKVN